MWQGNDALGGLKAKQAEIKRAIEEYEEKLRKAHHDL
jgi:hypothetical protein